ncbi:MAG: hypothetical protein KAS16_02450, partial [Thermoplasmata archaeon]|nr:hypothetical protein [Thermoplasmata archaeon]
MSENKTKQYLSVGIVLLFVMSAFGSIVNTGLFGDDMMADVLYENGSNDGNILIDQDGNDGLAKMDGSLQELVKNPTKGLTRVIIATTDPAEVATFLKDYEYRGLIGTRPISNGLDLSTYTLEVPIDCLDKLTELSSVYGIYSHPEQDASHYTEEANIGGSTGGLTPQNIYDVEQHNLLEAWSMGYIGTDSRVAIAEGGIDFGHPDLWETQARVPESLTVKGFTLIEAVGGEITAFIEQSDIVSGSYKFYINGTELTETTDYTFDLATGNLTLNSALEYGEILTTDYQFISPYAGWPIVFDYYSMSTYLETSSTLDTWYVATNETAEPYTEVGYPQLDLEIDIEMEETFSADPAESKTTTDLEHKTIKQNSVVVYADGNLISDTLYAVNYDLGQITFTPPIDVMKIEASYTYYQWDDVPVDQRVILQSPDYIPSEEGIPESYTISGLEPNENYFISIRATDEAKNHGDFSNNPEAATITDTTPPNQIIDLVATPGDVHGTLRLQWTAPGDDDVVGTTQSYVVKYSDKPITNWVCFDYMSEEYIQSWTPAVAGTAEDFALTGLPTGKDYYFAILAIDEGGNLGEVSNSPVAFVKQDTIDPSGISPIASTGMNDTEIYLQFDAPSDDAGIGTVTSYVLKYDTTDITDQTEFDAATTYPQTWTPAVAGTTVIYTLSLPASITDYYFSIIGVDEAGNTGPISSPAAMAQSQGPDIIDCSQIADLAVTTGTDHGMVDLTFTAPGDDGAVGWATEYIIKFNTTSIDSEADWDAVPEVNAISGTYAYPVDAPLESGVTQSFTLGVTNLDFSNLPPGVDYYFAIRAMDEEGNLGPVSNCDNALVQDDSIPPEAIDDLTVAVSPNHGEVILSWTAPGDDGAVGQASYYQIAYATYEITPANFDSAIAVNGTTRAVEHAAGFSESLDFSGYGLDLGTTYYFAIMGMDEARVNDPVSNCVNSIPRNDNATPSTIALVVATSDQHGSIDLTWDAPGDDGSTGTVTSYEIRYMAGYDENKYVDADIGYVGVLNPVMRWTTYDVTGIDSASGIYRLGTLNDENLATYVNAAAGEDPTYSKVLLVDSTTPYVYDTVYVDMDADQSFRDEKACVKGDEVAWRDMDGDGLADRAGGMVYYISQANTLGTTLEALTIVNGSVELVNQNIINNSAIIHWEGSRAGVDISAKIVKNKAVLDHDNVANVVLYLNGTALTGGDYIIDLETGAIDFIMNINTSYHEITTDYDFNTIMDSADYIVDIEEGIIGFSNIEEDDVLSAYYEWDGLPIPYSDVLADRKGVDNVIPQNGAMVAMYGEYAIDITDGTSRASAVVGKGMSSHKNDVDVKPCLGLAPDAKIVSIVDTGYDGMIFAIDGYDGIPGT